MLIWFALGIPAITTLILYKIWKHEVVVWEFAIPFAVSVLLVGVSHLIIQNTTAQETEYWGGLVQKAEYYEKWNERVPCSHPKYCTRTVTNADGTTSTQTYQCGYQHPYDVKTHPPRWQVVDTNGIEISISQNRYSQLVEQFGNSHFVDMNRNYHTIDGDKYEARWDRSRETAEVTTTEHSYENRIRHSDHSVFNYPEIEPEEIEQYGLYEYPEVQRPYHLPVILGGGSDMDLQDAEEEFQFLNGQLGPRKEVRVWVLLFEGQPREAGHMQEALWVNGNKNEFVITIGHQDEQVNWAHVFSWSESERLKIDTRHFVEEMDELDLVELAEWLRPEILDQYERRSFEEFSYLRINPPWWAILLVFLLTIAANIAVSWYVISNEYRECGKSLKTW